MQQLCAKQIKAARAYLEWSQEDLAHATGLAVSTIRNMETGFIPRGKTATLVRRAIENAGLEFIEPEGFRLKKDEIALLEGPESAARLFDDILDVTRKSGGSFGAVMESLSMLTLFCEEIERGHPRFIEKIGVSADILCLLPVAEKTAALPGNLQIRMVEDKTVGPVSYLVYGDRHVIILPDGAEALRYVVLKSSHVACSYRAHFLCLWEKATPVNARSR